MMQISIISQFINIWGGFAHWLRVPPEESIYVPQIGLKTQAGLRQTHRNGILRFLWNKWLTYLRKEDNI